MARCLYILSFLALFSFSFSLNCMLDSRSNKAQRRNQSRNSNQARSSSTSSSNANTSTVPVDNQPVSTQNLFDTQEQQGQYGFDSSTSDSMSASVLQALSHSLSQPLVQHSSQTLLQTPSHMPQSDMQTNMSELFGQPDAKQDASLNRFLLSQVSGDNNDNLPAQNMQPQLPQENQETPNLRVAQPVLHPSSSSSGSIQVAIRPPSNSKWKSATSGNFSGTIDNVLGWIETKTEFELRNQKYFDTWKKSFRKVIEYKPTTIEKDKKPYVLFVFPNETDLKDVSNTEFYNDNKSDSIAIRNFARYIADNDNVSITIIYVNWSGLTLGYSELQKEVNIFYEMLRDCTFCRIITLGYGFGGVIIKGASNGFGIDNDPQIESMIFIGTAVYEYKHPEFSARGFKTLLSFYSNKDFVQSSQTASLTRAVCDGDIPRKVADVLKNQKNIFDVRTLIAGEEPDSTKLKEIVNRLPDILERLKNYSITHDLELNIHANAPSDETRIQLTIRRIFPHNAITEDIADKYSQEICYSNKQRDIFANLYEGRDISQKEDYKCRYFKAVCSSLIEYFS